jgi:hypothetical protein
VEGCEGQQWRGGMASKFISDLSASDYKILCKGPRLEELTIEDLKPAQWYHFRVTIEYAGTCVISAPRAFATLCAPPDKPRQPNVYLIMNENDMFTSRNRTQPQVRLTWGPPVGNGSQVVKYHVQIQEYFQQSPNKKGLSTVSQFASPSDKNSIGGAAGSTIAPEKWRTVYCNLVQAALLEPPRPGCQAWGIRLRALNSSGWSEFSDPLLLDYLSHPNLFHTDDLVMPSKSSTKLPPLQKSHSNMRSMSTTDSARRGHEAQDPATYHGDDGLDIWSSTPLDTSELKKASALEDGNETAEGDDTARTKKHESTARARAKTAPNVSYEQPRCKTPSLLLPQNHPESVRQVTASAVDKALISSSRGRQSIISPRHVAEETDEIASNDLLQREIDRCVYNISFYLCNCFSDYGHGLHSIGPSLPESSKTL